MALFSDVYALVAQQASQTPQPPPEWWKTLGGILALPATVIGIAYSWVLIRKTRLESTKTELEIEEKRSALKTAASGGDNAQAATILAEPIFHGRLVQDLVLRFIILFLFLQVWQIVDRLFGLIFTGTALGLTAASHDRAWLFIPLSLIAAIPSVAYWLILLAMGWPLFRDSSKLLGIDLPRTLRSEKNTRTLRSLKVAIVLIVIVSSVSGPLAGRFLH